MDDRLNRIEEKQDKILDRLGAIDVKQTQQNCTLLGQASDLKEHMRRTALLESEVKPISAFVNVQKMVINLGWRLGAALVGCAAIIEGIAALLSYLKG